MSVSMLHTCVLSVLLVLAHAGSSRAGFTPTDIPGLELWAAAGSGVDADEKGGVSRWADRSGSGNDFVQEVEGLRPTLARTAENRGASVRFDGVDDELRLMRPINPSGKSVIAVVKWDVARAYSFAVGLDAGTDGYLRMHTADQLMTGGFYPVLYQNMVSLPKRGRLEGDREIFHFCPYSLMAFSVLSVTDNPPRSESIKWLGRNEMNNQARNRFAGRIAELLVYDRPLTDAERLQLEQYLGALHLRWPPFERTPVVDGREGELGTAAAVGGGDHRVVDLTPASGIAVHGFSTTDLGPGRYCVLFDLDGNYQAVSNRVLSLRVGEWAWPVTPPRASAAWPVGRHRVDFRWPLDRRPAPALVRLEWGSRGTEGESPPQEIAVLGVNDMWVERLPAVSVVRLRPDRIRYTSGAPAVANAAVLNSAVEPMRVTARFSDVTGFADARLLGERDVRVAPGEELDVELPFTVGETEYGRALRLELVQDGIVVVRHDEPYSVADNVWKVCIGANPSGPAGSSADYSEEAIVAQVHGFRDVYANCWEKYFWAPDDWGELTPEPGATWFSGQARRHENTERIRLQVETSHALGIAVATYGKCMAGGGPGWELARARPQWFLTDVHGRTMGRPADVWDMDHWQQADQYAYHDYRYAWTYRWVDLRRIDALDHGIDELIRSTTQFGWDAVRYDSGGFRANWVDGEYEGNDPINTRNMKRTKERIWAEHPDYLFGFNTANPTATDGRAYPLAVGDMSHEMREMLAGGGLWMGEAIKEFRNGRVTYTTWSQLARDEGACVRAVKAAGGHFCYLFHTGSAARNVYQFVIGMMIGAHPYGGEHVGLAGCENWGRFLTRWSGLIWDHRLRPIASGSAGLEVTGTREVWWSDFANERVVSATRRQVIVHILNPPLEDDIAGTGDALPGPVNDAVVRLGVPAGEMLKGAWFVSPGYPDRAYAIDAPANNGAMTVAVPAFDLWAMVVFDFEGRYTVPAEVPRVTEPLSEEEEAELRRTAPRAMAELPWFGLRPPAPTANIAVAEDLADPKPQHESTVEPKPYAETEAAPPAELPPVGGEPGLDVLVIKGMYHAFHRVPEAVRHADPAARVSECTARDLPASHAALFAYDVAVLVDMPADVFGAEGLRRLADFVRAGGRLGVLGGPFTLGQGFFAGSPLEDILPVSVRVAKDVYELPQPLPIGAERGQAYEDRPLVYYFHAATPREDASVRAWIGDAPILLERRVGKGASLVFLATMLGEAKQEGGTPFWAAPGWPAILGQFLMGGAGRP